MARLTDKYSLNGGLTNGEHYKTARLIEAVKKKNNENNKQTGFYKKKYLY
jgi:hypothetical protein